MTRGDSSFGDRLTDSEREFLLEVRRDWYLMTGSRLLEVHGNGTTASVMPVYKSSLANRLLRKGLVEKDKPYHLCRLDSETVAAVPLVLTYEGVIALDFASAQLDEEN
jgi:hypothetical protein